MTTRDGFQLRGTTSRRRIYDRLHAPDLAVVQPHFDAVRVCGAFGEDAGHDALRQRAGALVLLLHDLHAQPRANFTAYGHAHLFSVSCLSGVQSDPILAATGSPGVATTRNQVACSAQAEDRVQRPASPDVGAW